MENKVFPKVGLLGLKKKEKNLPLVELILQELSRIEKGGKNESGRAASPKSILLHCS